MLALISFFPLKVLPIYIAKSLQFVRNINDINKYDKLSFLLIIHDNLSLVKYFTTNSRVFIKEKIVENNDNVS